MGDLEPLGVNIGPIYAKNLSLKYFTVTQKSYSYSRKAPRSYLDQQVWVPDKFWKQNR